MTRVVLVVLDGFPSRHVSPRVTPHLWALAAEAGAAPATARGVMPSATYPNHATFVTGVRPVVHGVVANWFFVDGQPAPAETVGVAAPTLFDACAAAGRPSALVVGDHHLVGVMGGTRATHHWPPDGLVPEGAGLDPMGYLADGDLVPQLAATLADGFDLVVAQVNGPDTIGHLQGPDGDEALDGYRAVDALVPGIREALAPQWDETVVIVVSDHTMEALTHPEPIDVFALASEHGAMGLPEGGSALIQSESPPTWLDAVAGVAGREELRPGLWEAWTAPGWWFAIDGMQETYRGMHGNPSTLDQVAIVSGGHPAAGGLAERVSGGGFTALDWAPTIAALLGVSLALPA